ncbi:MAG: YmfQ family protein [Peptostreptococcaceae bacterium]|nr:YmfQ family protein [Peptostreptococcaceae bacterium]
MYSKKVYGVSSYLDIPKDYIQDEEIEIKREANLLEYLPSFYHNSDIVKAFMESNSIEVDILKAYAEDLSKNLYVKTATWGLDLFEEELGLITDKSVSYEERRERILAKKRGNGTTTKAMIKNTAEAFSGGEVEVIEKFNDYSFIVKFVGVKGIPKNLALFKQMLEEIKPAHLNYDLAFTYTVWDMIMSKSNIWNDFGDKTWIDLMTY